ncbi:hypothetical protein [Streptomyces rhizoryzae]|nr:hypothetical protein [Streptomyces rhizoryzae]
MADPQSPETHVPGDPDPRTDPVPRFCIAGGAAMSPLLTIA